MYIFAGRQYLSYDTNGNWATTPARNMIQKASERRRVIDFKQ